MLIYAAGSDIILAVIAFGIVLIPAVLVHELGHFIAAKLVGISVLEFGIGFPPRIARLFVWGETEFSINLLPIGGFVRPLGEDMIGPDGEEKLKRYRETLEGSESEKTRYTTDRELLRMRGVDEGRMMSVNDAPPLGRLFFMSAGAFANFGMAMLLFFLVALIGLPIEVGGLAEVAAVPGDSLFSGTDVEVGDVIEKINGERFENYGAFYEALGSYEGDAIRFSMLRRESGDAYEATVPAEFGHRWSFIQTLGVAEGSPSDYAGMKPGDLITHINGERIPASGDPAGALKEAAREYEGRVLGLGFLREREDGRWRQHEAEMIPRANPPEGMGRIGLVIRSQMGLADGTRFANGGYKRELIPQSWRAAVEHSLRSTGMMFEAIASIPGKLLDGSLRGRDARPISIIGISKIGGEFLQRSLREGPGLMMNFVAMVSIFLGIGNLLPIPALDGGRIVFVLLEILRGKPINPRVEARIHQVGILILLILGVVIMVYDLIDPPSLS